MKTVALGAVMGFGVGVLIVLVYIALLATGIL
jgi:hypothetical protein